MKHIFTISLIVLSLCTAREVRCQGSWSIDTTNGFSAVAEALSCVLNGSIYVIGGSYEASYGITSGAIQIFDPTTHLWTQGPSLPMGTGYSSCNALNGKIYAFVEDSVEIFDFSTNAWSTGPAMPSARSGQGSTVINGKIYVIGGYEDFLSGSPLSMVSIFDPSDSTWSSGSPMPAPRAFFGQCVLDGKIYVMGGYGANEHPLDTVEIFDPASNVWSIGTSMPVALSDCASSEADGKIYVMGGWDGGYPGSRVLEIFDTSTNTWSIGPDMPTGRMDLVSQTVNGKVYAIGGFDPDGDAVSANEVFTPGPLGVAEGAAAGSGLQIYPNPFSQSTTIHFTTSESGPVQVRVVNLLGEQVAQLFGGELDAGEHSFTWDAKDAPDGTYFCEIGSGAGVGTRHALAMVVAR